jgi:hypothetical protein
MSLSFERLQVVEVRDPITIVQNKRVYASLRSGSQVSWKQYTTSSISNSSIQFSAVNPPAAQIFVDRKQYLGLPIRLTFVGTAPAGQVLLNPGQDAPRAFPISSSIDTINITINNQSVSINMADIIQAMLHYNTDSELSMIDYSMTPSMLDQSQAYSQLYGSTRNPLGFYGDSGDKSICGRGSFPFTIVSNTNTSAVIDMYCVEPIFLSPFYFGKGNHSGFFNVSTMDFNITFLNNTGNRMWSHDAVSLGVQTTINSVQASFNNFSPAFSYPQNQPILLFKYITPNETQVIPANIPLSYSLLNTERYPTDYSNSVAAGQQVTINSNNIQLSTIPNSLMVYVRERNQDLYNTCNNPDTYFSINNINLQFMNQSGMINSASQQQLYQIAYKNGCKDSWVQWGGGPVYPVNSFVNANKLGTIGSILKLQFATDIGLSSLDAPGKLSQATVQITLNTTNISNRAIVPVLMIVVLSEGTFTIEGVAKASQNTGVITSLDILNARQSPFVSYADVEDVSAGNFLSGLKSFGQDVLHGVEKYAPKVLDFVKNDVIPIGKAVSQFLPVLGLGEEDEYEGSGVMVGGRRLSRAQLKRRLHR